MAWRENTPLHKTSRKVDDSSNLQVKWDFERLYLKDHPLTKLAPGNVTQMAHNVETWTISSSLAIIAAAKGDLLLQISQNICLVLSDDGNRLLSIMQFTWMKMKRARNGIPFGWIGKLKTLRWQWRAFWTTPKCRAHP